MKLVALKRLYYPSGPDGHEYAPGDSFDALSERDAKALTLVGKAKASDPDPVIPTTYAARPQPVIQTAAMNAEPEKQDAKPVKRQKRAYRRRDMKAED